MKHDWKWGVLLVGPALLLYCAMVWFPTILGFYQSLFRWGASQNRTFVLFENYRFLFSNKIFRNSMWITLKYMLINVPLQISTAYCIAYLLFTVDHGHRFFRFVFFIPVVLLTVAVGITFNFLFSRAFGAFEPVFALFGATYFDPLAMSGTALITAILADWWKWLGIKIMLFYAGFQNLPQDVLEAAVIDGANKRNVFFRIVVPLTWPVITVVTTLLVIGSLKVFDLLYVMTGGGPNHATDVITIHLVDTAFGEQNFGSGSAIAVIMFVLSLLVTLLLRRLMHPTPTEQ
jgi:raffinose/stachyose/melibiose transport system permease protein